MRAPIRSCGCCSPPSGLLFVIASSNVANLVLARTVRRESELAVRSALGASTAALRRSLLAESLVLCGSGALAAILLAVPMVAVLGRYASRFSVRANDLTLDFSLVWFGIALALIAAVFLAYIPRLPSPDAPQGGLTGRGARVAGGSSRRLRVFAVTQIMASFLLLAGACVLMKTLFVLEQSRPPFDSAKVLAINLPVMSYGKTPRAGAELLSRGKATGSARCREWSTCLKDSACPGATIGVEHHFWGAGFAWFLPVLPAFCATYWWNSVPYYYYNDVYYTYDPARQRLRGHGSAAGRGR